MYRFLDAGNTESFRMRSRPASKKRRGTKSREGWRRLGGARYGDLMRGPVRWWTRHWGKAICMPACRSGREREKGGSTVVWSVSTGDGCIDRREWGRERSPPAWSQRKGSGERRRAQDVWLMTCRTRSGSAAASARSRVRTPRSRSCGRRSAGMGRAPCVAHPARHPSAAAVRRQAGRHRGARGPSRSSRRG